MLQSIIGELFSELLQSLGGSAGFTGLRNQSGGGGGMSGDGRGVLPAVDTELSGPSYRQESPSKKCH